MDNFQFEPITGTQPTGNLDQVSIQEGAALGWSVDPDVPSMSNEVHCYVHPSSFIGGVTANLPGPGAPHPGNHRFSLPIPIQYRDGNEYALNCYGLDLNGDSPSLLAGSPKLFRFNAPIGWLDSVNSDGEAIGWSLDPDVPLQSNLVHFYVGGPAGTGSFIGSIQAAVPRPDVNQNTGYPGNHGFRFAIPAAYRNNQQHTLYAYGIDLTGDTPKPLNGNPKSFNLAPTVQSVHFESIAPLTPRSIPLGENPNSGGNPTIDSGLRVFPDDDYPGEDLSRERIRVVANIGTPLAGQLVYFRNFDLDDPSSDPIIDPDGNAGGDNFGRVAGSSAGQLHISSGPTGCDPYAHGVVCRTNAEGIASAEFTVTRQPGDNFAIAASGSLAEINGLTMTGLILQTSSGTVLNTTCPPGSRACRSRMLTVWRRLHIETDSMGTVEGNQVMGRTVTPIGGLGYTIPPGETREIFVSVVLEVDQFENGRFLSGVNSLFVLDNQPGSVRVLNSGSTSIFIPRTARFDLFDDDDFNYNDGDHVIGDSNEKLPQPDTSLMKEGIDDGNHNVFAPAYVRVVYDIGQGESFFAASIVGLTQQDVQAYYSFDNIATDSDPEFWTAYLLNGYQPWAEEDQDPETESLTVGVSDGPVGGGGQGSIVFLEAVGIKECTLWTPPLFCNEPNTAAHEVAHQIGAEDGDGGLMNSIDNVLSPVSIYKIRRVQHP